MYIHKRVPLIFTYCLLITGLFSSCYKKDIQVGSDLAESHTRIITVDTVSVVLSSFLLDSFITNGDNYSLIGNYNDIYTGNTSTSTYLQPGLPTLGEDVSTLLPKTAQFDSLVLYMRPSGYYYGDTTKPFDISVYELAEQPEYTVGNVIYNKTTVPVKPGGPMASWSGLIRPSLRDSVKIKMPFSKGNEFFEKLRSQDNQVSSEGFFLDYFRGLSIQPNSNSKAVYGFNLADTSIRLRLHYHQSLPYKADKFLDFVITRKEYQFNRIVTNRTGTPLEPTTTGQREFFASATNPFAITQAGTGVYLKARFPSLRDVLKINEVVRLMSAHLVLKPIKGSYDLDQNRLPNPLFLATTNESNIPGGQLPDTTGQQGSVQYRSPVIDFMYGTQTTYTFNVTSYINALMNSSGSAEQALFIMEADPNSAKQINRGVIGSRQNPNYQTQLILNLLTIE